MQQMKLNDNAGNVTAPNGSFQPVLATGQKFTDNKDTNNTATVEAGKQYIFTALVTGGFYLGLADVTTEANAIWICPAGATIMISIPVGYTTLHWACDTNNAIGYLREMKR